MLPGDKITLAVFYTLRNNMGYMPLFDRRSYYVVFKMVIVRWIKIFIYDYRWRNNFQVPY